MVDSETRTAYGRAGPASLTADGDPVGWTGAHADPLHELLNRHGAVHIAGTRVHDAATLAAVRDRLATARGELAEQFAECHHLGEGVYTAPEWAPEREMCLHHEQSQAVRFPRLLVMAYVRPADTGGTMLLADTRQVLPALPAAVRQRFADHGWRLIRNFRSHLGMSWAAAFGARLPQQVEAACAAREIEFAWLRDGTLRTQQHRPAVVHHPMTGEACWFNDVAFFSQWSVPEPERALMLETFTPAGLPFNTASGDGRYLDEADFDAIISAYDRTTVSVDWQAGDLLLVDNILTAHGREVYTGDRQVLVAFADPVPSTASAQR